MRDKDLYAAILGIQRPWQVADVTLAPQTEEVRVRIEPVAGTRFPCPTCGQSCPGYDSRRRAWRHLDTCQFKTILEADVPRVQCPEHGVVQIEVPWAEPNSGFTALMEALIIDWLLEANIRAVAGRMRLSWDQVDGVMQRAVRRGIERRKLEAVRHVCVDETSYQKRHEYVTIVSTAEGGVLHVADSRGQEALDTFWQKLTPQQLAEVESVSMDMWRAYIRSTTDHVPGADRKISFDRFHVARAINEAVDEVRKGEHRELAAKGDSTLAGTKYYWLKAAESHGKAQRKRFGQLKHLNLKVGRAWAIKETARGLWSYDSRAWAERAWKKWLSWAMRCRLAPMRNAALLVKKHLWGILNAVVLGVTNARAESTNAKIQWIKNTACGFRNRERFRNAIYFHCGKLDLYPPSLRPTHTTS